MSGLRLRLLTVAVTIGISLSAFAQSQKLRDRDPDLSVSKKLAFDLQQATMHYGPWYLLSQFRLADAGYTEQGYLPTGDQTGGLSLTVESPNRLYFVPDKKTILSVELTPGYSFFRSEDRRAETDHRQTQFNYRARADAHFLFNHVYLNPYVERQNRLQAHVADVNRLATAFEDEVGVGGELKYSSRTSALFIVRYRDTSYPSDRFQPDFQFGPMSKLDRNETNARASVLHKTFPLTSLFVAAERSKYDFDDPTVAKSSTRSYYAGGLQYDGGRTTMRLEAGPAKLDFDAPGERDYSGVMARFDLNRSNGRWNYRLGADRDLGFSVFVNNNYFVSDTLSAAVNYKSTRRLTLRAGSTYERDRYDVRVFGNERRDTISFTSGGFLYTIRRLTTGLDVGWYERDSTFGGDEDSGIRYVLHLSFTP